MFINRTSNKAADAELPDIPKLKGYRDSFYDTIDRDGAYFENKITYISAGAIVLFITFMANIPYLTCTLWLACTGLGLTVVSLLINISLYLLNTRILRKNIKQLTSAINKNKFPGRSPEKMLEEQCRKVDRWNIANLIIMGIGIILLVIFVCINV